MNFLFGKKKVVPNANESIEKMKNTLELLEKREALLQKKIDLEIKKAKEFLAKKNKNAALMCMKRKKAYEDQMQRISNQKLNIEQINMKLEEAALDMETLNAQRAGASALQNVYNGNTADTIDKDMDKVRDAMDTANEISDAISQSLGGGMDTVDEDDLLNELNELDELNLQEQMLGLDSTTPAVTVGTTPLPTTTKATKTAPVKTKEQEDNDAFAELEASLI